VMKKFFDELRKERDLMRAAARVSSVGFTIVFSILIGLGIGLFVDKKFNTSPWGILAFLL